jgi:acetyltransferase-like isoleucine patch superfamily enzyme
MSLNIPFLPMPQYTTYPKSGLHLRWRLGWVRANLLCRPYWALKAKAGLMPTVHFGKRISFITSVRVVGPAASDIYLGDDCILDSKPDLYTQAKGAKLNIGSNTYINGTRFGVFSSISVGKDCILADVRLMDTDFHSVAKNRVYPEAVVKHAPITIENNVWIAAGSAVLKGVTIGQDSVIAFGSVVVASVPAGKIFGGNPAKEIGNVN